jgi:hypothetical protein
MRQRPPELALKLPSGGDVIANLLLRVRVFGTPEMIRE